MRITLDVPNEQLFEKILWFLDRFKGDGVQIITNPEPYKENKVNNAKLKQFEQIINMKSANSIKVNEQTILNPHTELTNDIS
jgi:hypothetical protein